MISVLIVDDHKILRDGISAIFKTDSDIEIVGECEDGSEVLGFLKSNKVDVILMDIMMPKMNGIDCTKLVKSEYPKIKILAMTMHNESSYIHAMLEVGANGYILKNTSGDEMHKAILRVFEGKPYFASEVTDVIMNSYLQPTKSKENKNKITMDVDLTKRELDILKLITEEYTNKEIGEQLNISSRTVDTHRRNLLRKIGAKNSIGLIRFAYNSGLID
ncbi:MAG: response regulator transcription factor [Bacteroidales bacterium]|jgi:DNA-binding NarL/FixJ family response regulator|nr:response regulator transcription factor [Bacteroidales bacterium]